jgi:hypothetical protein
VTVSVVDAALAEPVTAKTPVPAGQKTLAPPVAALGAHTAPLDEATAQMRPALQGFASAVALALPTQKPTAQGRHAAADVAPDPPVEKVPGMQAFVVPDVCPAPHQ